MTRPCPTCDGTLLFVQQIADGTDAPVAVHFACDKNPDHASVDVREDMMNRTDEIRAFLGLSDERKIASVSEPFRLY